MILRTAPDDILVQDKGYHRKMYAKLGEVRGAWMAISENPSIHVRDLSQKLGISQSKAGCIMKFLEQTGYVQRKQKTALFVEIPFVQQR